MNIPKTFLTEAVDKISILKILTQSKSGSTSDPHYKELADWAGRRQSKIKNIELSNIKISDRSLIGKQLNNNRYNTLGSLLNTLKSLMDRPGGYDSNNEQSNKIQKITLEILEDLKAKEEKVERPKEESELYEGMDWTAEKSKRLTEARDTGEAISSVLEKFYNDYYSVEYAGKTKSSEGDPNIVTKLKSLDKILIPEFNALGYNPEVNPLAQFLKLLIKHKPNIFNKLTTNTYGAIHNSFIDQTITGNMLGNYNGLNILFCSDLYSHRGLDIVEYISLWKEVYNKAKGDAVAKSIWAAKIVLNQPRAVGKTYDEKANSLKELQSDAVITPSASEAKLRSVPEIRELYRYIFKAEIAKEKNSKTLLKKEVNSEAVVDMLNKAIKQNVVLDMIKLILEQEAYKDKYSENTRKITDWLEKRNYTRSQAKINDSNNILQEYALTVKILNTIINALKNHVDKSVGKKS